MDGLVAGLYEIVPALQKVAAALTESVGLGLSLARNSNANGFFMIVSCDYSPFPVFRSWQSLHRGCQFCSSQKST